ncbi:MAG TPA: glycosyltransferase family A protein [Vicinamibacterales bacterium]
MPVKNEAWILRHSLGCLSAFCDVVIVADQNSDDDSREICRQFPNVVVLESAESRVCEQARWQLLDAARAFDGDNLLWHSDADELVSPRLAGETIERVRQQLAPGAAIECSFYHLWNDVGHYRDDGSLYQPQQKSMAVLDDRGVDYDRSSTLPFHQPRVSASAPTVRALDLPVFHLQWLIANRNQIKQAWYRCKEWMNGGRTAADINRQYSITLLPARARTSPVLPEWVDGITFPSLDVDREPCWQEEDVRRWFDERGPAFFEPLEIWHVRILREKFLRATGRAPRPDRSYRPHWTERAGTAARRIAGGARRRVRAALR